MNLSTALLMLVLAQQEHSNRCGPAGEFPTDSAACTSVTALEQFQRVDPEYKELVAAIAAKLPEDTDYNKPREAFLRAERDWQVYRDSRCQAEAEFTGAAEFWIRAHAESCRVSKTRNRFAKLRPLSQCLDETGEFLFCSLPKP